MARLGLVLLCLVALLASAQAAYKPKIVPVGGAIGWSFFVDQTWLTAVRPKVFVGDVLSFKNPGHTVQQFKNAAAFQACNFKTATPLGKVGNTPLQVKVTKAGWNYYGCSVMAHCMALGQKVAVFASPAPK